MSKGDIRRRGIYLLPNLFTTSALFCGFYSVVAAHNEKFVEAAIAIFIAMIMDGLDGRVARLTNTQSDFGVEYDSISDMLCFGVAPSLVIYLWALSDLKQLELWGDVWGKVGWLVAFIYTACAALRLARFNTQVGVVDKKYFQGLASPAAAAVLMGFVWFVENQGVEPGTTISFISLVMTLAVGILMVSNVRYYSFKVFDKNKKVPFLFIVAVVLLLAAIVLFKSIVLFAGSSIYALSGPVITVLEIRKKRLEKRQSLKSGEVFTEESIEEDAEESAENVMDENIEQDIESEETEQK